MIEKNEMEKDYSDACLKEVIELLDSGKITIKDFNRLQNSVKDHHYYDEDIRDVEFEDVMEYLEWGLNSWERERLLMFLGVNDDELKYGLGVKSLDDEYRFEMVMKLFKLGTSEKELESFIKPEILEKIKYIEVDV
jgi:hypothetical protein